jgi:hypothetical protein
MMAGDVGGSSGMKRKDSVELSSNGIHPDMNERCYSMMEEEMKETLNEGPIQQ